MQLSHSSTEETQCRKGCLVVVRRLVIHVAVLRALLTCVPPALLGVFCLYLTGLIPGSEVSATAISQALGEVAHEAVIRSWPRLRGWLAEDREFVLVRARLTQAAVERILLLRIRLAERCQYHGPLQTSRHHRGMGDALADNWIPGSC